MNLAGRISAMETGKRVVSNVVGGIWWGSCFGFLFFWGLGESGV